MINRGQDNLLPDFVARQIDEISVDPDRPLVITDADEVIIQFVVPLEEFLGENGYYLDLSSFKLIGNVKDCQTNAALEHDAVMEILDGFFAERTEHCPPVPGAAEALRSLSGRADILILSNVPIDAKGARARCLAGHGLPYPLIANKGLKGPAIRALSGGRKAPTVFLDDLPQNHASVAADADEVHRIHFIADQRLAILLDCADEAHVRIDTWPEAQSHMEGLFDEAGY